MRWLGPFLISAAACGDPSSPCELSSAPWTARLVFASVGTTFDDWTVQDLVDGAQVPLIAPPQGGHIALIGARVEAGDGCTVETTAALRDLSTQRILGLDARPMPLADDGTGWATPTAPTALAAMPNVGVCPTAVTTTTLDGSIVGVEVTLQDHSNTPHAMLSATAMLVCNDPACRVDCAPRM
jgi:hypothetical protein